MVLVVGGLLLSRVVGGDDSPRFQVTATDNVAINQDPVSVNQHNSPSIAQNPKDPANLVVGNRIDRPVRSGVLHVSTDSGKTWADIALPLPDSGKEPGFAPDVAFDANGRLYVVFSTIPSGGAIPSGIWVETSDDGGRTLSTPVRVAGPQSFHHRLAVNPTDGRLHVTWLQADKDATPADCLPCFTKTGLPVVAATSTDGGQTWSPPVRVSDEGRARVGAATPVVSSDGTLHVLYQDFKENREDWENLEQPPHPGTMELVVAKSGDGGATFSPGVSVDAGVKTFERVLIFFPKHPALAASPSGELYATWQDARNGDYDVLFRRSIDGGTTWQGPFRVNSDPVGNGRHQYLPAVSGAAPGRVDVLYYDRRDDPRNILAGAYFATSFDRGEHWESVPASDQLFDSRLGPGSERKNPDPGSRLGLISSSEGAWAVWTDSRRGTLDTEKQDIFGTRIAITRK